MYIIMELCTGGELSDELKKRTYFKEEVSAVLYQWNIELLKIINFVLVKDAVTISP